MTPPRLVVDLDNGVAPWRQIRDQLVQLVGSGMLPIGTRLPTIRQLATDLHLAPGTVARAYRELENDGVLHTARRRGTVVARAPVDPDPLRILADAYVARAQALGADLDAAVAAVRDACSRSTTGGADVTSPTPEPGPRRAGSTRTPTR